jgi:universal stress protein E
MDPFESILVGVDFSRASRVALRHATRIAGWSWSGLHATHVVDKSVIRDVGKTWCGTKDELDRLLVSEARTRWDEFAHGVVPDLPMTFDVGLDDRAPGLLNVAARRHADLLVIGFEESDRAGAKRMVDACLRQSAADVLVIRGTQPGPFRKIVAAVDFTDTSRRVVERAAYLAAMEPARLYLVHLSEAPWHGSVLSGSKAEAGTPSWREKQKILQRELMEFTRPWLDMLSPHAIEWRVEPDEAHRAGIGAFAREYDADLVVLGTRTPGSMHDRFFGTAAEAVLHDTRCCVLAVKPPAEASSAKAA